MADENKVAPTIPSESTLAKLALLVQECRIAMSPPNYSLHANAVAAILEDPGVIEWMNEMKRRGLNPEKREAKTDLAKNKCITCGKVIQHEEETYLDGETAIWCMPCYEKAERDAEMNRQGGASA